MATTTFPTSTVSRIGTHEGSTPIARVFATADSIPLLVTRLTLGLVMLPHGLQKTLGIYGGYGFHGTMGFFTQQGIPAWLAFLAIMAEALGSLGLITGFLARIAAFGIFCNMLVATVLVHMPNGLFMNWSGLQKGEGFEFHLLAMGLAIAVMVGGAGRGSFDRLIWRRKFERDSAIDRGTGFRIRVANP